MNEIMNRDNDEERLWSLFQSNHSPRPLSCPDAMELAAYLDNRLTPDRVSLMEEHLSECKHCRDATAELRAMGKEHPDELPKSLQRKLKQLVRTSVNAQIASSSGETGKMIFFSKQDFVRWTARAAACLFISCLGYALGQNTVPDTGDITENTIMGLSGAEWHSPSILSGLPD